MKNLRDLGSISTVTLTVGVLLLSGCAQAEDAVRGAANSVASSAASQAAEVARNVAREQLCKISADGKVSSLESETLKTAVTAAERAGVSEDIIDAARQLADEGTATPRKTVTKLRQECAAA